MSHRFAHLPPVVPPRHPRAGRGTQLTASQEAALIKISMLRRENTRLAEHTKSFWRAISSNLLEETGRVYSWQSCRPRMLDWEAQQAPTATQPSSTAPSSSPAVHHDRHGHESFSPIAEENEEDDLPAAPVSPLHRDMHAKCEAENDTLRVNVLALVMSSMDAFESQIQCFTTAIIDDQADCDGIAHAFDHLKNEIHKAIEKYNRSADRSRGQQ